MPGAFTRLPLMVDRLLDDGRPTSAILFRTGCDQPPAYSLRCQFRWMQSASHNQADQSLRIVSSGTLRRARRVILGGTLLLGGIIKVHNRLGDHDKRTIMLALEEEKCLLLTVKQAIVQTYSLKYKLQ